MITNIVSWNEDTSWNVLLRVVKLSIPGVINYIFFHVHSAKLLAENVNNLLWGNGYIIKKYIPITKYNEKTASQKDTKK